MKKKPYLHDINPKAVTNDELFGFINPATREWRDGKDVTDEPFELFCFKLTRVRCRFLF